MPACISHWNASLSRGLSRRASWRGVNEIAPQSPEPRERALLVRAGESTVADNVGDKDRRKLSRLGHFDSSPC